MAATESFTDQVFLANWGLSRITVLDYFLHPLNPFKTKAKSCNEILAMQGTSIGLIMQNGIGMRPGPVSLSRAEEEYNVALTRLTGHQYELVPAPKGEEESMQSPLFTIRHVYRHSPTKVAALGIYYVLEGVIYKSPSARSLMKANVTRTCQGLIDACNELSQCAKYAPNTGPYWDFGSATTGKRSAGGESEQDIFDDVRKRSKRARRVLDNRPSGERTEEEEEGIRAKEKINCILLRLKGSIHKKV